MPPISAGVAAMIESSHAARRWRRHGHRIERLPDTDTGIVHIVQVAMLGTVPPD
jgi:hypothetical protein